MGFWALHNVTPKLSISHAKFTRPIMRRIELSENKGADCNYREELTPIDKVMCEEHWALVENL